MTPLELDRLLERLSALCAPAVVAGGFIADFQRGLEAGEEKYVASAVRKRREEFEAGRCAARMALERIGIARCPILRGEHGQPLWPEGVVGSITHSDSLCLVACVKISKLRAVGIDVERMGRMERRLWRIVFTDEEADVLRGMPDEPLAASVAFSAKEAFMKAQFVVSGRVMEFKSMRVKFVGEILSVAHTADAAEFADVPRECVMQYIAIGDHAVVFCALRFE